MIQINVEPSVISRITRTGGSMDEHSIRAQVRRLVWLCPVLAIVLAALVLWTFGLSFWTALVTAVLLACPLGLIWAVVTGSNTRTDGDIVP
jgi:hypothetical protein